jgi:hypothetical protein
MHSHRLHYGRTLRALHAGYLPRSRSLDPNFPTNGSSGRGRSITPKRKKRKKKGTKSNADTGIRHSWSMGILSPDVLALGGMVSDCLEHLKCRDVSARCTSSCIRVTFLRLGSETWAHSSGVVCSSHADRQDSVVTNTTSITSYDKGKPPAWHRPSTAASGDNWPTHGP